MARHQRAFTLVEMLAVLAVIGILGAAASPSFVRMMRDSRVATAASRVAEVYRVARARALGRGGAVMVRWQGMAALPTPGNPGGHFEVREAIMGAGSCGLTPVPSCLGTDWSVGSANSRYVTSFDERAPQFAPAMAQFMDLAGNSVDFAQICYTPRGRTYINFGAAQPFVPLRGVARVNVVNAQSLLSRPVLLPPTGVAHVVNAVGP
ncbi:MAG: type II secretion system protein [Deltaproteobacteria bacterium]|nr:type II secretion system protein [Deltaproteobacteria bacterium]